MRLRGPDRARSHLIAAKDGSHGFGASIGTIKDRLPPAALLRARQPRRTRSLIMVRYSSTIVSMLWWCSTCSSADLLAQPRIARRQENLIRHVVEVARRRDKPVRPWVTTSCAAAMSLAISISGFQVETRASPSLSDGITTRSGEVHELHVLIVDERLESDRSANPELFRERRMFPEGTLADDQVPHVRMAPQHRRRAAHAPAAASPIRSGRGGAPRIAASMPETLLEGLVRLAWSEADGVDRVSDRTDIRNPACCRPGGKCRATVTTCSVMRSSARNSSLRNSAG